MTQEHKELLLKDLCARLPYGVKFKREDKLTLCKILSIIPIYDYGNVMYFDDYINNPKKCNIDEIKPYLFPLESMTEEQKKYVTDRWGINENFDFEIDPNWGEYFVELGDVLGFINWCYENHLDINGLIPKGLAIDCTNLNIY